MTATTTAALFASAADQAQPQQALRRDDLFTVVVDCFATDTADYADIVLPAASFLEFDDLTFNYMTPIVGASKRLREPVGDSLSNQEIFRRLASAMGFDEPALFETDESLIARLLEQMSIDLSHRELAERGHVYLSESPVDFFADRNFDTPSGRIEIASDVAAGASLDRLPHPTADQRPGTGRFRLLSAASQWRLNDTHANDSTIGRRSGPATVTMHLDDATAHGVTDGDMVVLHNSAGRLELQAKIDNIARPGVLVSRKGRWPKLEPSGHNVNVLHEPKSSDIDGCSAVHGTEVSLDASHDPEMRDT